MPATRSNRLGLALVLVGGALGCATAQHQGQLDGAAVAMLSAMIVALYGVALKVMSRTTDAADHVMIRASLGAGAATMLMAGSHWTEREVIPALEAQTGRSLRGCHLVLAGKALRGGRTLRGLGVREGSELEVRHRRHGGAPPTSAELATAFKLFDSDGDGVLSAEELKAILCRPTPGGTPLTEQRVDEIMRKFDVNTDGVLSVDELAQELRAAGEKRLLELPKGAVAFEETTPMLVMPFKQFKAQGRICKSTKAWREEALQKQWLVVYDESSGKVVIFISHTCAAPSLRHRKPAPSPAPLSILRPPCSLSRP